MHLEAQVLEEQLHLQVVPLLIDLILDALCALQKHSIVAQEAPRELSGFQGIVRARARPNARPILTGNVAVLCFCTNRDGPSACPRRRPPCRSPCQPPRF